MPQGLERIASSIKMLRPAALDVKRTCHNVPSFNPQEDLAGCRTEPMVDRGRGRQRGERAGDRAGEGAGGDGPLEGVVEWLAAREGRGQRAAEGVARAGGVDDVDRD